MNWRLLRFVFAHPIAARRFHVAANAAWPEATP